MATKPSMKRTSRKNIYIAAVAIAVVVWIVVEAVIPGVSENLSVAAQEVVDRLGTTIPAVTTVVVALLAALNLTDDPEGTEREGAEAEAGS